MAVHPSKLIELSTPVPEDEIKTRPAPGSGNKMLSYVDARFVMQRLDDVGGRENWSATYEVIPHIPDAVFCTLGIKVEDVDGQDGVVTVEKTDIGTGSQIEGTKGMVSDALKRAAVSFGIARELYVENAPSSARRPAPSGFQPATSYTPPASQRPGERATPVLAPGSNPRPVPVPNETARWLCPTHESAIAFPAGGSKKTGKPYAAFYSCAEDRDDCSEKPPRGLEVAPEHLDGAVPDGLPF